MDAHKQSRFIAILALLLPFYTGNVIHSGGPAFAAEKLSGSEIILVLNTYDRFTELMMRQAGDSQNKAKGKEDFSTLYAKVMAGLDQAEVQACLENGIARDRYQSNFHRIFMVKTYLEYKDVRDKLTDEIKKKTSMTAADLDREAERSYREMEGWYHRVGGDTSFEDVKKKRDENLKQYLDSIAEKNRKIDEYNRNLPPDPKIAKIEKEIRKKQAQLADPRLAPFYDDIKRDIAQLKKLADRMVLKNKHRRKSTKKPDPLMLKKINEPVKSYYARRKNDYYTTLMQGVRDKKASGQWRQTVEDSNQKKVLGLRATLRRLDALLADSRLQQAATDADIVNQIVDRLRLMALSPLPWQNIPKFP